MESETEISNLSLVHLWLRAHSLQLSSPPTFVLRKIRAKNWLKWILAKRYKINNTLKHKKKKKKWVTLCLTARKNKKAFSFMLKSKRCLRRLYSSTSRKLEGFFSWGWTYLVAKMNVTADGNDTSSKSMPSYCIRVSHYPTSVVTLYAYNWQGLSTTLHISNF